MTSTDIYLVAQSENDVPALSANAVWRCVRNDDDRVPSVVIHMTFAATPDVFTIHAASLDDPHRFKPQMVTYTVRGYAWDHLDPALQMFDRMPST